MKNTLETVRERQNLLNLIQRVTKNDSEKIQLKHVNGRMDRQKKQQIHALAWRSKAQKKN